MFAFVLDVRQTESVNMNVTIAAILQYYNIPNPEQVEQEPWRVQGFTVLLYESFYAG